MSRFVPAGTVPENTSAPAPVDDDWAAARQEVKSKAAPNQTQGIQNESKGLYETLEANKAAKQAEFEESIRLKNQFKALDEDDVDFLDSVLESERAKEDAVKRETAEQIEAYRKQQAAAQKVDLNTAQAKTTTPNEADAWVTKKRRRKELDNPISKLRKTSSGASSAPPIANAAPAASGSPEKNDKDAKLRRDTKCSDSATSSPPAVSAEATTVSQAFTLGLGAYSSDED